MSISVVLVKQFTYRGAAELWSNRYHLSGGTPADATAWKTLVDAIRDLERPIMPAAVTFVAAYGYASDSAPSVYQLNYADPPNTVVAGSFTFTPGAGNVQGPGDVAFWVRWATAKRNSKGRPVYARKYYHGVVISPPDSIQSGQRTAAVTAAGHFIDSSLPGARNLVLPDGTACGTVKVPTFTTTRTLKRRGADPS